MLGCCHLSWVSVIMFIISVISYHFVLYNIRFQFGVIWAVFLVSVHIFSIYYLRQGEHSKHWWRLSNRFFCLSVCLSVHTMTHNAAAPVCRHNSNDIILQRKHQCWHTVITLLSFSRCREVVLLFSLPFPCLYPWLTLVAMAMKFET